MDENFTVAETTESPAGIGAQLRAAREERGLSLEQVAAETRIPQRHLVAIEAGDFGQLPGRTYAVGFSRTYAKMVGLDQDDVAAIVRAELDAQAGEEDYRPASFEPGDPARAPSRALFYFSIFAGLIVIGRIALAGGAGAGGAGRCRTRCRPDRHARGTGGAAHRARGLHRAGGGLGPVLHSAGYADGGAVGAW